MNNKVLVDESYDFDKLSAYEIKDVTEGKDGEKVITVFPKPLIGLLRHVNNVANIQGMRCSWPTDRPQMVQIIEGKPMAVFPTEKIIFVYKENR